MSAHYGWLVASDADYPRLRSSHASTTAANIPRSRTIRVLGLSTVTDTSANTPLSRYKPATTNPQTSNRNEHDLFAGSPPIGHGHELSACLHRTIHRFAEALPRTRIRQFIARSTSIRPESGKCDETLFDCMATAVASRLCAPLPRASTLTRPPSPGIFASRFSSR